ncbi:type II 3-dehydroquinate dehydratase [Stappia sp. F7233]|uniref:3-dehydroquinate dehydratase n=1 Tax=Stappia albiluteola TaxID=2758565 RepID=A0A839AA81_9HYPH|nr:type II 3-dehydroquinate dehydratase [Stappia albiluteola]MBA5776473.1 type II 3-dehydroquinate dehydratase [Stappia albiluteola]
MSASIYILNGPNLNRLGTREPATYGKTTLADIESMCRDVGEDLDLDIEFRQSNVEGILVDWIQEAGDVAQGLIINPAAYTHTSVAIHDAIRTAEIPTIEVHLSNVFAREAFRHHSYVSPVALGVICGFGATGYRLALEALSTVIRP